MYLESKLHFTNIVATWLMTDFFDKKSSNQTSLGLVLISKYVIKVELELSISNDKFVYGAISRILVSISVTLEGFFLTV